MYLRYVNWAFSLLIITNQTLFAVNISGKVTDSGSGDFLPGANVMLEGTNYGASSDRAGNYTIVGVQSGDYTLRVSYVGYSGHSEQITVGSENSTNNVELSVSYISMDLSLIHI